MFQSLLLEGLSGYTLYFLCRLLRTNYLFIMNLTFIHLLGQHFFFQGITMGQHHFSDTIYFIQRGHFF